MEATAPAPPAKGLKYARILLALVALGVLLALGRLAGGYIPVFQEWVKGLGAFGPLVFIAGYAVAVIAFIIPSLVPWRAASSRTRLIRKML